MCSVLWFSVECAEYTAEKSSLTSLNIEPFILLFAIHTVSYFICTLFLWFQKSELFSTNYRIILHKRNRAGNYVYIHILSYGVICYTINAKFSVRPPVRPYTYE